MLDGLLEDVSGEGLSVPVILVLDIGEIFSLESLGNDAGWLVGLISGLLEGTDDGLNIVSINNVGLPSERGESLLIDLGVVSETGLLRLSESVDIDDADQVIEIVVRGEVGSLPDGSLSTFSVSKDGPIGVINLIKVLRRVSHTSGTT